jgi:signal transduction histidine kinase
MSDTEWIQYAEAVERRMQRMRRAIDDMRSNAVRDGGLRPRLG